MASHKLFSQQSLCPFPLPRSLTLPCFPQTDIWATPPSNEHFSASFTCTALPLSSFRSIQVTITAKFSQNTQQGGLILVLPPLDANSTRPAETKRRWVTATLEYEHERMNISVVSCERWSDWSLFPAAQGATAVLRMERGCNTDGSLGPRLRVSMLDEDGKFRIIREVTWAFEQDQGEIWVGVLANKAFGSEEEPSEVVKFENLVIETG